MNITVVGTSKVAMAPERGTLHLTVGCEADDPETAMHDCTATVNELAEEVRRLEAADPSPITWHAVLPIRTRAWRPWNKDGVIMPLRYGAHAQIKVKFCDFAELSEFANRYGSLMFVKLDGVEWTLTEKTTDQVTEQVQTAAVQDAVARATIIADAVSATKLDAVEITDPGLLSGIGGGSYGGNYDLGAPVGKLAARAGASQPDAIDLLPEDVEVSATVHARFTAE